VAQVGDHLLCKLEILSSNASPTTQKIKDLNVSHESVKLLEENKQKLNNIGK
jgi:hypothetical protein